MIEKIGLIILVLFSCGAIYLADYYSKQYESEKNAGLRAFFKQTRDAGRAKVELADRIKIQLLADLSRCETNAAKINADYLVLLQKHLPSRNGKAFQDITLADDANVLMQNMRNECKAIYDEKLKENL